MGLFLEWNICAFGRIVAFKPKGCNTCVIAVLVNLVKTIEKLSTVLCHIAVTSKYWVYQWLNEFEFVEVVEIKFMLRIWVMMPRSIVRLEGLMWFHIKEKK